MTAPRLLGLCGFAGSGKTTVGNILAEQFGYHPVAFADPVRELAAAYNPIIGTRDYDTDGGRWIRYNDEILRVGYEQAKADRPEIRDVLVRIGVGTRKTFGIDVFVDAVLPKDRMGAWELHQMHPHVVVTDTRYPNESYRIHELGGEVWLIDRPGVTPANHEEARTVPQVNVDACLRNDGTLTALEHRVAQLLADRT